ncbi:hypothetical protein QP185_15655 [Sphingomonas aerolata]|uniref:hypothetical protein n=1 Tax=Sphingomonas aerolata TaxID=185951 RepID=UPI002FE4076E
MRLELLHLFVIELEHFADLRQQGRQQADIRDQVDAGIGTTAAPADIKDRRVTSDRLSARTRSRSSSRVIIDVDLSKWLNCGAMPQALQLRDVACSPPEARRRAGPVRLPMWRYNQLGIFN